MSTPKTPTPTTTPSQFTHTITKVSVTQILKSIGFKYSNSTALETLTRITTLFLHHLSASAAAVNNQPLSDIVFALENLNFPLDFSIPQLHRFLTDSESHLPFPHRRIPKSEVPTEWTSEWDVDLTRKRSIEVPSWLPAFPRIVNGDRDVDNPYNNKEVYWEERCAVPIQEVKEAEKEKGSRKTKRGIRDVMVYGRRERLKFKFKFQGRMKAEKGNVDDLELRNGVCRGGKRVGLVKRVCCNRFFDNDDDD